MKALIADIPRFLFLYGGMLPILAVVGAVMRFRMAREKWRVWRWIVYVLFVASLCFTAVLWHGMFYWGGPR